VGHEISQQREKTEKQVREEEPAVKKRKCAVKSSTSDVSFSKSLCSRQIRPEIVKFWRSIVKFRHEVVKISVKSSDSGERRQIHSKIVKTTFWDNRRYGSWTQLSG
jgi:hypothetical protein